MVGGGSDHMVGGSDHMVGGTDYMVGGEVIMWCEIVLSSILSRRNFHEGVRACPTSGPTCLKIFVVVSSTSRMNMG